MRAGRPGYWSMPKLCMPARCSSARRRHGSTRMALKGVHHFHQVRHDCAETIYGRRVKPAAADLSPPLRAAIERPPRWYEPELWEVRNAAPAIAEGDCSFRGALSCLAADQQGQACPGRAELGPPHDGKPDFRSATPRTPTSKPTANTPLTSSRSCSSRHSDACDAGPPNPRAEHVPPKDRPRRGAGCAPRAVRRIPEDSPEHRPDVDPVSRTTNTTVVAVPERSCQGAAGRTPRARLIRSNQIPLGTVRSALVVPDRNIGRRTGC